MTKYKVTVNYQGSVELIVEADSLDEAKGEGFIKFEEVSATEIEASIFDVSAEACEMDEEDDNDT